MTESLIGIDLPKPLPKAALTWLQTWKPDPDQRQWMKGESPIWPNCPPEVFEKNFSIPKSVLDGLCFRIIKDSVERVGYAALGTPEFVQLACLKPEFGFQRISPTTGKPDGTWLLAPQEISIRHLRWCFEQGHVEAGHLAAITLLAYYNNEGWPHMRTGGNPEMPYLDAGRCRTARGCVDLCANLLLILEHVGIISGPAVDWLEDLAASHVQRILKHWPLVDTPKGDHLSVPFMSTYQTATLHTALGWLLGVTTREATAVGCEVIRCSIEEIVLAAGVDGKLDSFYYDIAIEGGKPKQIPEMNEAINVGVSGVGSWIVPVLATAKTGTGPSVAMAEQRYNAMLATALKAQWPTKYPQNMARFFGSVA